MPTAEVRPGAPNAVDLVEEGDRYREAGNWSSAESAYRRATALDPERSDARAQLGCLMADARRFPEAVDCFRRLVVNKPAGHLEDPARETIRLLSEIATVRPEWARGQFSLACAYEHIGDHVKARAHLASTLSLDPSKQAPVEALNARMLFLEKKYRDAIQAADRSLAANPDYYLAHLIRAKACSALGRPEEAVRSLRRSVEIVPDVTTHSQLLFEMNYLAETTPESLYTEACRWNSLYAAPLASQIRPHRNPPDPNRRLRIGYVSPDLYQHTIMKFVPPLFERHDRSLFEVFAYAVGPNADHISDQLRQIVPHYVSVPGTPQAIADRVRADGIDILIDLAGHTMGPELLAFALKPAPVQISWMGYAGTTGMTAIDYYLGDPLMPCPGTESCFSEIVYRLPVVECCYRPIGDLAVAPAPCLANGYTTFGSFNNPRKITRDVAKLWSAILHLVRQSRLLLKFHGLESAEGQARLRNWFEQDGIAPERVGFEGQSAPGEYLAAYSRIDVALDPFPYNGGSTTLDALWMGVPVVSLAGRLPMNRAGASILAGAGLGDLIAKTAEEYLRAALFLAAASPIEPELRSDIRKALSASPWMDEISLVRNVEGAYREMWRRWCRPRREGHAR